MRSLKIALTALTFLALAACSDSGGGASTEVSDEAKPYVESLSTSFSDPDELGLEPDQADCLAATWVNTAAPERLKAAGVEPDALDGTTNDFKGVGLSKEDAETMVDGFEQCDIDLRDEVLRGIAEDEDTTDEEKACLEDALDVDAVREFFVISIADSESEGASAKFQEMVDAQAACTDGPDA